MFKYSALLLFSLLFAAVGCQGKSNVLATVQGKDFTQAEFDAFLRSKRVPASDANRRTAALDELLDREALASVIEKQPSLDKTAIDAELADVRRELLINRYMDAFLDGKVTDAAIKNYYDAHAKDYEQHKVHAAHILVRTNTKMVESETAARLATATDLRAKLEAGANFEELARTSSDDKISGVKGGDLGWLREGSIDAEFSKRAFSQPPGTVSEPFQTPFGYHILKVLEPAKVIRRPYAAVAGEIRYQLRAEAKEAELKRLKALVQIKKKNEYKLDPKAAALDSARRLPPPAPVAKAGNDPSFAPDVTTDPAASPQPAVAPASASVAIPPTLPLSKKTDLGANAAPPASAKAPPAHAAHPAKAAAPAPVPAPAPAPAPAPPAPTE